MRRATLTRTPSADDGTFGVLVTDTGFTCLTGELPWRNNAPDQSCIPPGKYICSWGFSQKHGHCYHVAGVSGRTHVQIHAANWMGAREKGFKCQLLGCIAPGLALDQLEGQRAMIDSREALARLVEELGRQPFELTIV